MSSLHPIPEFRGKRLTKVSLRTLHLIGFAGVFGAALGAPAASFFWAITGISGLGLLVFEAGSDLRWFVQIQGGAMYLKGLLLWVLLTQPEHTLLWNILIITLSGMISHASRSVRHFSLLTWRVDASSCGSKEPSPVPAPRPKQDEAG